MGKRINICTVQLVRESAKIYDLDNAIVRSPEDARDIVEKVLGLSYKPKEHFVIATLDTKNKVQGMHTIHVGSLNSSIVHPREVFQLAILNNANSIVCFHNHPSGDVTPSREDIEVTKRLVEAGKIMGIEVLDHIIIGTDYKYTSLKEKGYC